MGQDEENPDRTNLIDKTLDLLVFKPEATNDMELVLMLTLRKLLALVPEKDLRDFLTSEVPNLPKTGPTNAPLGETREALTLNMPEIDSPQWIDWFVRQRTALNIKKVAVIRECVGVYKGDLTNFEKKKLHFGTERRRRLLEALVRLSP